jgi:hypothetical protein
MVEIFSSAEFGLSTFEGFIFYEITSCDGGGGGGGTGGTGGGGGTGGKKGAQHFELKDIRNTYCFINRYSWC